MPSRYFSVSLRVNKLMHQAYMIAFILQEEKTRVNSQYPFLIPKAYDLRNDGVPTVLFQKGKMEKVSCQVRAIYIPVTLLTITRLEFVLIFLFLYSRCSVVYPSGAPVFKLSKIVYKWLM